MRASGVDVSVVIVNWNTRALLLDVIASLRDSTQEASMEIIVVDNASHDGSQAALREHHPEVQLIQNDANLGFARANNIGFAAARGRALCLVNTDVIALDGVIDTLYAYLVAHPEVGAVGPRTYDEHGATRQNCRRFPSLANALGDHLWLKRTGLVQGRSLPMSTYDRTHRADVLSGCFLMVRRDAFEHVGGLDEDFFFYGEDTDWGKRFNDAGWGCVYLPEAEAIHIGGGSTKAYPVKYYLVMEKSDLLYWRKHHPLPRRAAYVAIRLLHNLIAVAGWSAIWLVRRRRREHAALKVHGNAVNTVWLLTRKSLVETPGWS
ncbi:MAG: glycosyltransferase [Propionibacterium sp.]|nr:glycosyltransferase [Propionibacterium sp.]